MLILLYSILYMGVRGKAGRMHRFSFKLLKDIVTGRVACKQMMPKDERTID